MVLGQAGLPHFCAGETTAAPQLLLPKCLYHAGQSEQNHHHVPQEINQSPAGHQAEIPSEIPALLDKEQDVNGNTWCCGFKPQNWKYPLFLSFPGILSTTGSHPPKPHSGKRGKGLTHTWLRDFTFRYRAGLISCTLKSGSLQILLSRSLEKLLT